MNALKFKRIIYVIAVTALITLGTQVYRSVQNYELNKERFVNDMQQSLDLSLEAYFADLTRNQLNIMVGGDSVQTTGGSNIMLRGAWSSVSENPNVDQFFNYINRRDSTGDSLMHFVGTHASAIKLDSMVKPSMIESINVSQFITVDTLNRSSGFAGKGEIRLKDSLERLKGFAQKIVFSMAGRDVQLDSLDQYLKEELDRRDMRVKYMLVHYGRRMGPVNVSVESNGSRTITFVERKDTLYSQKKFDEKELPLEVFSNNTFLSKDQRIALKFENASLNILKRGGVDFFISLLITTVVIGSLMYLYGIINEQKQLAEIKNDLISNITHEFKTPIATISTAMEGISNFNQANDVEKTNKYLGISKDQLKKLNGMVEKLLETASLDSNELEISKEEVEVVAFTRQIFERFHVIKSHKHLSFQTDLAEEWLMIDPFHMENAVGNLVDNAIKYGGDEITIRLTKRGQIVTWQVEDNGGKINKLEQQRIFDKFYRIPTGNVHNVKGFGIGLYYTKTLVEKHGGRIGLQVSNNSTLFSIEIANDKA